MKYICSRCNKEIEDLMIKIETTYQVLKKADTGVLIPYNNLSEPTSELLCPECFDLYSKCMDQLNEEYEGSYIANMVEVIDDIQYGDDGGQSC